jgi:hypothetical protein
MSFINAFFAFLAVFFIRTRPASPEASGGGRGPWVDKDVIKQSGFWSISISLVVATLGYGSVLSPTVYAELMIARRGYTCNNGSSSSCPTSSPP